MKKILLSIILGLFLLGFVSAVDCRPKISIEVGIYDKILERAIFERSLFQPNGFGEIIQEGDYFFIESFSFYINNSCGPLKESVRIKMKLPGKDNFSSVFYIPLENALEGDGLIKYSFKLNNLTLHSYETYIDNSGNFINLIGMQRMDIEGKWEVKVLYGEEEIHLALNNEGYFLTRELDVRNRLEVQKLENAEEESKRNKTRFWVSIIVPSLIALFAILFMWVVPFIIDRKKQRSLLGSLLIELNQISNPDEKKEGNLQWFKNNLGSHFMHGVWVLNVSPYLNGLNNFRELKKNLVIISQKIGMLNGIVLFPSEYDLRRDSSLKDFVKKTLEETINLVENSKKLIKKFKFRDKIRINLKKSKIFGRFNTQKR